MRRLRRLQLFLVLITASFGLRAQTEVTIEGRGQDDPFTVSATVTPTQLTIAIAMKEGWHMYGKDVGGGDPVSVTLLKSSCFSAAGALRVPSTEDGKLTGTFELSLPLRRTKGRGELRATFSLMTCDAMMCLPPNDLILSTKRLARAAKPLKVLLVSLDDAARTSRIEKLLDDRGFACDTAEYGNVRAKDCDRYDLVIADSPNADKAASRAAMSKRQKAVKFPETKTPIIAVGYLGTVLLESQGMAMASGYI